MQKVLWQTKLADLKVADAEGVGNVRNEPAGKDYVWVKNASATALVKKEPCWYTDVDEDRVTMVYAANRFAGVPVTAIAASGSTVTGAHGWVQKAGICEDAILQGTATAQAVGGIFIASTGNFVFEAAAGTAPTQVAYAMAVTAVATTSGLTTENSTDLKLVAI